MVSNEIVLSKLIYLIQWWGGCSDYLINFLQILQNRAARLVTRLGWFTPVEVLLHQCGWLSVRQMVHYHSLVLLFKIQLQGKPEYFKEQFSSDFPYRTRLATGMGIRRGDQNQHDVTKTSFVPRTIATWNLLPVHIRSIKSIPQFKQKLKAWIQENLPI